MLLLFWRRAIGAYTNEQYVEDIYYDSYWGDVTRNVLLFRFSNYKNNKGS